MIKSRQLGTSGILCSSLLLFGLMVLPAGAEELGACVQKNKGNLRLVSGPQACNASEIYVVWNVQGPQGDPGPKGEKGDTGDPGPQGEKGDPGGPPAPTRCEGRIEQFTLIWDGPDDITITTMGGLVVSPIIASNGEEVTFSGGSQADENVFIQGTVVGESRFHLSGSDQDMNADDDCGKFEGDGKENSSFFINEWLLEGFVCGNGYVLECTSAGDL